MKYEDIDSVNDLSRQLEVIDMAIGALKSGYHGGVTAKVLGMEFTFSNETMIKMAAEDRKTILADLAAHGVTGLPA